MHAAFFPNPVFGWAFYVVLLALLVAAAYVDLRWLTVPKPITLSLLGLGLVMNIVRGAWLGGNGTAVWVLGDNGSWIGALDGILFALAGFALSFAIFFVLWIMGASGGGDLKLFAALGAGLGPVIVILVLIATIVIVLCLSVVRILRRTATRGVFAAVRSPALSGHGGGRGPIAKSRLTSYSLPVAVAAAVVLLWVWRVDLRLSAPPETPNERAEIHVR